MITKYKSELTLSGIVIIAVFVLLDVFYPYHLLFLEERSLFLTTKSFATSTMNDVGGVARYIGLLLTTLLHLRHIGAALIAILFGVITLLIAICSKLKKNSYLLLALLPNVLFVRFILHTYSTLTIFVGLIIVLASTITYQKIDSTRYRLTFFALLAPLLYYSCGSITWLLIYYAFGHELWRQKHYMEKGFYAFGIYVWGQLISLTLIHITDVSRVSILLGPNYTKSNTAAPETGMIIFSILLAIFVNRHFPIVSKPILKRCVSLACMTIVFISAYTGIAHEITLMDEKLIKMYTFGSREDWDGVIAFAKKERPENGNSMAYYNLALAQKGELLENYMNTTIEVGVLNLIPNNLLDYISCMFSSDLTYQSKIYSVSYQMAVEAQNTLPTELLCCPRLAKRLAEASIATGDIANANKFIYILQNTLFYKEDAKRIKDSINNRKKHRNQLIEEANMGLHENIDRADIHATLELVAKNKIGGQYLIATDMGYCNLPQLKIDIEKYYNNKKLPKAVQEAYSIAILREDETLPRPENIDEEIFENARAFNSQMLLNVDIESLKDRFAGTYFLTTIKRNEN